jgi:hypothetical protein
MNRTKTLVIALWAMFVGQFAIAQKGNEDQLVKDANTFFAAGAYLKAFPLYSQLVSLYPNHAEYTYKFGACAIYGDADKTKAVRYLNAAIAKSVNDPDVYFFLGRAYHLNYQFKDAITAYENYVRYSGEKGTHRDEALRQIETCIYGANLLSNIKDITVLSKTETDKENFFRYFNLEAIGGKILTIPDALKTKEDMKSSTPGVIHYPGNGTTIYFSSYGKSTSNGKDIYKAQILPDGTFSEAEKIKGGVNTKYDEDFCFMHSDGKTLYFASKGHNSMGGYDIFKSVYDPMTSEFGPAVNLDFAINTPDDDIFYIADSLNQRAYFASSRSSDLDHINVYNVLVETTPLQVVYLKGQFVSEIDPEQHMAGIKILESNSSRSVCEGTSNGNNGEYIVYVPKSGSYTFKVVTENSPTIHEVTVKIPTFDKPVALRQEMRLINEGGKERILINNYFESPLDEDLSVLAAEMLRKKSVLDVNTNSSDAISLTKTNVSKEDELRTFEQNMENTAIAAGFEAGVTTASVLEDMKKEHAAIQKFINESDTKRNNSLAYARKKQQAADAAVAKAEMAKQQLGAEIITEEDLARLKEVVELTAQAEVLQQEAQAAFTITQAIATFKESEAKRGEALQASFTKIQEADQAKNYEATVAALTEEKDRRTAVRDGVGGAPQEQMMANIRSLENERAKLEVKLTALADDEKTKAKNVRRIQENLNSTELSKSEKEALQNDLATAESVLSKVRKELAVQNDSFNKSEGGIKMAYAEMNFFALVEKDSDAGLEPQDMVKLSSTERDMLGMSIAALDTRVSQLEIKDPAMLAMLGTTMQVASNETSGGNAQTTGEVAASVTQSTAQAEQTATATTTANNETTTTTADTGVTTAAVVQPEAAIADDSPVAAVRTSMESRMAYLEANPTLVAARPLVIRQAQTETRQAIAALNIKSKDGSITAAERGQLDNLIAYDLQLSQDLQTAMNESPEVSSEDVRVAFNEVAPDYETTLMAIENEDGTEIDRAIKRMEFKRGMISQLEAQQLAKASAMAKIDVASNTNAPSEIEALAMKDAQLSAAIISLQADANRLTSLKAAFELENKTIIESDEIYANKLQDQMILSEQYMSALTSFETAQREALNEANEMEKPAIEAEIAAIEDQRLMVEAKQMAYRHDLELTASASAPAPSEVMTDSISEVTVDELNPLAETPATEKPLTVDAVEAEQAAITAANEAAANTTVTTETVVTEKSVDRDAAEIKKMFASKEEVKSIFAYEGAAFAELSAKHPEISARLNNMDKIESINDDIILTEAEMEATKSESSLKKLDVKAEQLYLKRSMLEIENANVVADLTREEYNSERSKANELMGTNQEKINEKVLVRDEVARLKRESEMNMEAGDKLREQARPIYDDIERADYYRQAYALEALAIDQQRQIQSICSNLELLNQYNEADLAILKTGTVPASQKKDVAVESTESNVAAAQPAVEATALNTIYENNNAEVVEAAKPEANNITSAELTAAAKTESKTNDASIAVAANAPAQPDANAAPSTTVADNTTTTTEVATDFARVEANAPVTTENAATQTVQNDVTSNEAAQPANETPAENNTTETPAQLFTTRAENVNTEKTKLLTEEVQIVKAPEEVDGQKYNDGQVITTETISVVTVAEAPAAKPATTPAQPTAPAEAKAKASANAADYYYSMPSEVVADLFAVTARGVYSDSRPIPIDMEMPKGVYYKVQIGAFRNDIPQNLYDQFAPISGERLNTGITRYTAGFFVQFDNAKQVKQQIRALGYNDAFIVAYRDGKRIPLYEAAAITDGPELAASIKAAFDKAAVGSMAQNTPVIAAANTNAPANNTANNAVNSAAGNQNTGTAPTATQTAAAAATNVNAASTNANATGSVNVPANNSAVEPTTNAANLNIDAEVAAELARKPVTRTVEEIEAAAAQPKNTEYYKPEQTTAAQAQQVETVKGLFYTIQVGVYSKPVAAALLQNINPLNSELTETGKIRYTSGQFNNMADAVVKRDEVRKLGIADAFITAYYNGKRLTLSEADLLLKEKGAGILAK